MTGTLRRSKQTRIDNQNQAKEMKTEKPDNNRNPRAEALEQAIEAQRRRERNLFPLRVNRQTVIYVTRRHANAAYEAQRKEEAK